MLVLNYVDFIIREIALTIYDVVFNHLQYVLYYECDIELSSSQLGFIIMFFTVFVYVIFSIFVLWLLYKVIVGFIRLFV